MRIIGLDPGVTTGYVAYSSDLNVWVTQQLGPDEHHAVLYDRLFNDKPDIVVFERFAYQRRDKVVLTSVEYIGIIKLFCRNSETPYKEQTPSQAKNLWSDDKVKKLGLWKPNMPHAMDAVRHVLYYVTIVLHDDRFLQELRPAR